MNKKSIIKHAFIHAIGAAVYIALVVTFINNVGKIIGEQNNKPLGTMLFLLTLVISAAVMGMTIFARPIMWYLDGKKSEALSLIVYTIAFLFVIALILFFALIKF